jgi:acetate kinase
MVNAIAVLNAGSSSIKFSIYLLCDDELELHVRGQIEGIYTAAHFVAKQSDGTKIEEKTWPDKTQLGHEGALDYLVHFLRENLENKTLIGIGHRVVHGGIDYASPMRMNSSVLAELERLVPLAPLHQPHNLSPIRRLLERLPDIPQVACFDTSFHSTNPELSQRFALPEEYYLEGVRRYGFHGISYEYIASCLAALDQRLADGKVIVLHLGNGASMCAMEGSRSIASTMAFTTVEGLLMGTRCGSLDPGVLLYLMNHRGMDALAIQDLIYNKSGLLGVSGISSDMRTLLASNEARAELAIDLYCYRIRRETGSLAAALGGVDGIVFTGGIGENSSIIRQRVCHDLGWLGISLDPAANDSNGPRISTTGSAVSVWTIPTDEELMIARHTKSILEQV